MCFSQRCCLGYGDYREGCLARRQGTRLKDWEFQNSPRTILEGRALGSATSQEASWSKSNFS